MMDALESQGKSGLVVKSNSLIYATYALNMIEQRLILLSIVSSRKNSKPITATEAVEIYAKDYVDMFEKAPSGSAYLGLREAVVSLYRKELRLEEFDSKTKNPKVVMTRWVSEIAYIDNEAKITLTFAPRIIEEIAELEKRFTTYYIEDIRLLTSAYALRLYELIIAWRSTKKTKMYEVSEFRAMLGVEPHQYKLASNFKARVLDIAVSQINERTNIKIEVETHKRGRNIIGFSFTFVELIGEKETIRDPNTVDWVEEEQPQQKQKREKMTLNQIVARHPTETMGLNEPEIFSKFGSKYHIVK